MKILLSPAKNLDFESCRSVGKPAVPVFEKETEELVGVLKKYDAKKIQKLMKLSDKLSSLNAERYQKFSDDYNDENARQAILAFTGDVYRGFDATSLSDKQLQDANDKVRILSGLYGLLKPLDYIQPYRLEMGTPLKIKHKKSLYEYWGDKITEQLNEEEQLAAGVTGDYVRVSAGTEHIDDIIADFDQALKASQ